MPRLPWDDVAVDGEPDRRVARNEAMLREANEAIERRFVMREGHERTDLEVVIEKQPGYVVVEKRGQAGAVAERDSPRD